jgi:O-acetyl-ADP-ribose deacetylase (regulator of RNase III)
MITEIKKDILSDIDPEQPTVIIHGCNCFHTMGTGVAKSLKEAYPQVYKADVAYKPKGDKRKLGLHSMAKINDNLYVLNCYTQYRYGKEGVFADYEAIEKCLKYIGKNLSPLYTIRTSKIGCGNAGGDWKKVKALIKTHLSKFDVYVYYI